MAEVIQDAKKKTSKHDFGGDIIPQMVGRKKVFAYNFRTRPKVRPGTGANIGLLDAYYRAHQDLLGASPVFALFDPDLAHAQPAAALSSQQIHLCRFRGGGG